MSVHDHAARVAALIFQSEERRRALAQQRAGEGVQRKPSQTLLERLKALRVAEGEPPQIVPRKGRTGIWRAVRGAQQVLGAQRAIQAWREFDPTKPFYVFDVETIPFKGENIITEIAMVPYQIDASGKVQRVAGARSVVRTIALTPGQAGALARWVRELQTSGRPLTREEREALRRLELYAEAVFDQEGRIISYTPNVSDTQPNWARVYAGIRRLRQLQGGPFVSANQAANEIADLIEWANENHYTFLSANGYRFDEPILQDLVKKSAHRQISFKRHIDLLAFNQTIITDPIRTLHEGKPVSHGAFTMDAFRESWGIQDVSHSAIADIDLLARVFAWERGNQEIQDTLLAANQPINKIRGRKRSTPIYYDPTDIQVGDTFFAVHGLRAGSDDLIFDAATHEPIEWMRDQALYTRTHYVLQDLFYDREVGLWRAIFHNADENFHHVLSAPTREELAHKIHSSFLWAPDSDVVKLRASKSHAKDLARRRYLRMHQEVNKPQQLRRLMNLYRFMLQHPAKEIETAQPGDPIFEGLRQAWAWYDREGRPHLIESNRPIQELQLMARRIRGDARHYLPAMEAIAQAFPDQPRLQAQAFAIFHRIINEQSRVTEKRRLLAHERHMAQLPGGRWVNMGDRELLQAGIYSVISRGARRTSPRFEANRAANFRLLVQQLQETPIGTTGQFMLTAAEAAYVLGDGSVKEPLHSQVLRLVDILHGKAHLFTPGTIDVEAIGKGRRAADWRQIDVDAALETAINSVKGGWETERSLVGDNLTRQRFVYGSLEPDLDYLKSRGIHLREALDYNIRKLTGDPERPMEVMVVHREREGRVAISLVLFDPMNRDQVKRLIPGAADLKEAAQKAGAEVVSLGEIDLEGMYWWMGGQRKVIRSHYKLKDAFERLEPLMTVDNFMSDQFVMRMDSVQWVMQELTKSRETIYRIAQQEGWGSGDAGRYLQSRISAAFARLSSSVEPYEGISSSDIVTHMSHDVSQILPAYRFLKRREELMAQVRAGKVNVREAREELARLIQDDRLSGEEMTALLPELRERLRAAADLPGFRREGRWAGDLARLSLYQSESMAEKGILTAVDTRALTAASELDPQSRAHIEQLYRSFPTVPGQTPGAASSHIRDESLWLTESALAFNEQHGWTQSKTMRVMVATDDAILERLKDPDRIAALRQLGYEVKDILPFISTHEQHMGIRESAARTLDTELTRTYKLWLSHGDEPMLWLENILLRDETGRVIGIKEEERGKIYKPGLGPDQWDEELQIGRYRSPDGSIVEPITIQNTHGIRFMDAWMDEEGNLVLKVEELRRQRHGGKLLVGGDKGTGPRWDDELFDIVFGERQADGTYRADFDIVANFNIRKHRDYSMPLRGQVMQAISLINEQWAEGRLTREQAEAEMNWLADQVVRAIGWDRSQVRVLETHGALRLVTPDNLPGDIPVDRLNELVESLRARGYVTETSLGQVIALQVAPGRQNDIFNELYETVDEEGYVTVHGKKGIRISQREIRALREWGMPGTESSMERTISYIENEMAERNAVNIFYARSYRDTLLSLMGYPVSRENAPVVHINDLMPMPTTDRLTEETLRGTILNPYVDGKYLLDEQNREISRIRRMQGGRGAALEQLTGGYWLDLGDIDLEGEGLGEFLIDGRRFQGNRIWIPLTHVGGIRGANKQLNDMQYRIVKLHEAYNAVRSAYGLSDQPLPKSDMTRRDALRALREQITLLAQETAAQLTAKRGIVNEGVMAARFPEAGRGQVAMLSPRLTVQYRLVNGEPVPVSAATEGQSSEIVAAMNRRIKEAAARVEAGEAFREGEIWMTSVKARKILGRDADDLIRQIQSGKIDFYALGIRYPTFHQGALAVMRVRIFPDDHPAMGTMIAPDDDRFFMTPGTAARMRGDTDGDEISLWLTRNAELQAEWHRVFNSEAYQNMLYQSVQDAEKKLTEMNVRVLDWNDLTAKEQERVLLRYGGDTNDPLAYRLQKLFVGPISNSGRNLRENTEAVFNLDSSQYQAVAEITDLFEQKGISAKHSQGKLMGELVMRAVRGDYEALDDVAAELEIDPQKAALFKEAMEVMPHKDPAWRLYTESGMSPRTAAEFLATGGGNAVRNRQTEHYLRTLGVSFENLRDPREQAAREPFEEASRQSGTYWERLREAAEAGRQERERMGEEAARASEELLRNIRQGSSRRSGWHRTFDFFEQARGNRLALIGLVAGALGAAAFMTSQWTSHPLMPDPGLSFQENSPPPPPMPNPSENNRIWLEQGEPEGYEIRVRGRARKRLPIGAAISESLQGSGVSSANINIVERDDTTTLTDEWVAEVVSRLLG